MWAQKWTFDKQRKQICYRISGLLRRNESPSCSAVESFWTFLQSIYNLFDLLLVGLVKNRGYDLSILTHISQPTCFCSSVARLLQMHGSYFSCQRVVRVQALVRALVLAGLPPAADLGQIRVKRPLCRHGTMWWA